MDSHYLLNTRILNIKRHDPPFFQEESSFLWFFYQHEFSPRWEDIRSWWSEAHAQCGHYGSRSITSKATYVNCCICNGHARGKNIQKGLKVIALLVSEISSREKVSTWKKKNKNNKKTETWNLRKTITFTNVIGEC